MKHKEATRPKNFIFYTILFVFGMTVTLSLAVIFFYNAGDSVKTYQLYSKANFTKVYATIVRYEDKSRYNATFFSTFYEYKTENWTYKGLWHSNVKTEEKAKAQIGQKVPIYIDDKLGLQTMSLDFSLGGVWFYGAMGSGFLIIFLVFFTREILLIQKLYRYKKFVKENEEINESG